MGRVYAVVSAKGGVGKTTTAANLAAALAASGVDVAVVDGDLGMANLADALGVDSAGATLHDVLAGEAALEEATREGPHGMTIVPGSPDLDAFARADPEGLRDVLASLADDHDYVLLDTGAGLSNDTVVPLTYVDEAVLVSTTARGALGDTEKTRQVAVRLDVPVAGAVITRVDPDAPRTDEVDSTLDAPVIATIPSATVVRDAGDVGEPLTTYAPGSTAAAAYRDLAADLTGERVAAASADDADAHAGPDGAATDDAPTGDASTTADDADRSDADRPETGEDAEDIIVAGDHEADAEPDAAAESTASDADTGASADEAAAKPDTARPYTDSDVAAEAEPDETGEEADVPETAVESSDDDPEPAVDADEEDPGATGDDPEPVVSDEPAVGAAAGEEPAAGDDPVAEVTDDGPVGDESVGDDADSPDDANAETTDADEADDAAEDDEPLIEAAEPDVDVDSAGGTETDAAAADETPDGDDDGDDEGVYTTSLTDEADDDDEEEEKTGLFGRFLG